MENVPKTLRLTPVQALALKYMAARDHKSESEIVREALDRYIPQEIYELVELSMK